MSDEQIKVTATRRAEGALFTRTDGSKLMAPGWGKEVIDAAIGDELLRALVGTVAAWDKWFQSLPRSAEDDEFGMMLEARAAISRATQEGK